MCQIETKAPHRPVELLVKWLTLKALVFEGSDGIGGAFSDAARVSPSQNWRQP